MAKTDHVLTQDPNHVAGQDQNPKVGQDLDQIPLDQNHGQGPEVDHVHNQGLNQGLDPQVNHPKGLADRSPDHDQIPLVVEVELDQSLVQGTLLLLFQHIVYCLLKSRPKISSVCFLKYDFYSRSPGSARGSRSRSRSSSPGSASARSRSASPAQSGSGSD